MFRSFFAWGVCQQGRALCLFGTCATQGLCFVSVRNGLLLAIPVVIVIGFLLLPQHLGSSFDFVLAVTVIQFIKVVGEIKYLA